MRPISPAATPEDDALLAKLNVPQERSPRRSISSADILEWVIWLPLIACWWVGNLTLTLWVASTFDLGLGLLLCFLLFAVPFIAWIEKHK